MQDIALTIRILLGAVFLTSSLAKLKTPSGLVQAVQQYGLGLVGPRLAQSLARLLPPFELILGLSLVIGLWLKMGALVATVLLLIVTLSMALNLARGNRFRCNCFGAASSDIGIGSLGRNVVLIVASLALVVISPWSASVSAPLRADALSLSRPDTAALFIAGISVYAVLLAVGEIDSLLRNSGAR